MLNKLGKKLGYKEEGFTIIEVMIVLAIAGLILVIVLIAIPQLQRNQRNAARRDVANRITTEINNFAGNNNGDYPDAATTNGSDDLGSPFSNGGFFTRYLGCSAASGAAADCTTNINDPQTSFPVGSGSDGTTLSIAVTGTEPGTTAGDIFYLTGVICDGEVATTGGANARNFAFIMRLEGGAGYCLDNR